MARAVGLNHIAFEVGTADDALALSGRPRGRPATSGPAVRELPAKGIV